MDSNQTYQVSQFIVARVEILQLLADEFIQNPTVYESLRQLSDLSPVVTRMT